MLTISWLSLQMRHREQPPPLPWRPVTDVPEPGVFCSQEALHAYSFLSSEPDLRDPDVHFQSQATQHHAEFEAGEAPLVIVHNKTQHQQAHEQSSDVEVLSAERPVRKRSHFASHVAPDTADSADHRALAQPRYEDDQPAQKLSRAQHQKHLDPTQAVQSKQRELLQNNSASASASLPSLDLVQKSAPQATHSTAAQHNTQAKTAALVGKLSAPEQATAGGITRQDWGSRATTLQAQDSSSSAGKPAQVPASHSSSGQSDLQQLNSQALADKLNPNNAAYDPEFAAQHRSMRAKDDRMYAHHKARKSRAKLLKRGFWTQKSSLTREEHAYLLDLQGVQVEGKDAAKLESLKARLAKEQQEYLRQLRSKAFSDRSRYTFCYEAAAKQIEAELVAERELVKQLPQLWRLSKVICLESAARRQPRGPHWRHLATLSRHSGPAKFSMPELPMPIDPDCPYMSSVQQSQPEVLISHAHPQQESNAASANNPAVGGFSTLSQTEPSTQTQMHQESICQEHTACREADLLITEAAYQCITSTYAPSYSGGWELPVRIQEKAAIQANQVPAGLQAQHAEQQVVIDAPLVKRKYNWRERHELLYEHAVRMLGQSGWDVQNPAQQAQHVQQSQEAQHAAQQAQRAQQATQPASYQKQRVHSLQQQAGNDILSRPYSPSDDMPAIMHYHPSSHTISFKPTAASHSSQASESECESDQAREQQQDTVVDNSIADSAAAGAADFAQGGMDPCVGQWRDTTKQNKQSAASRTEPSRLQHVTTAEAACPVGAVEGHVNSTATAVDPPPAAAFDHWQLGMHKIVTRRQLPVQVVHSIAAQGQGNKRTTLSGQSANRLGLVGPKMEFLEEWGFEQLLPEELAKFWASLTLQLQHKCDILLARVGVHSSHLLDVQPMTKASVAQQCQKEGVDMSHAARFLTLLISQLQGMPPGQYLLTHQAAASAISLFVAEAEEEQEGQNAEAVPLPLGPLEVRKGVVYDLHVAHVNSGATDTEQDLFTGAWQQADPAVDQVPFTFPPASAGPHQDKGNRAKAPAAAQAAAHQGRARGRGRGRLPRRGRGRSHGRSHGPHGPQMSTDQSAMYGTHGRGPGPRFGAYGRGQDPSSGAHVNPQARAGHAKQVELSQQQHVSRPAGSVHKVSAADYAQALDQEL